MVKVEGYSDHLIVKVDGKTFTIRGKWDRYGCTDFYADNIEEFRQLRKEFEWILEEDSDDFIVWRANLPPEEGLIEFIVSKDNMDVYLNIYGDEDIYSVYLN